MIHFESCSSYSIRTEFDYKLPACKKIKYDKILKIIIIVIIIKVWK